MRKLLMLVVVLGSAAAAWGMGPLTPDKERLIQIALGAAASRLPQVPAADLEFRRLVYSYSYDAHPAEGEPQEFIQVVFCRRSTREVVEMDAERVVFYDEVGVRLSPGGEVTSVSGPSHRALYRGQGFGSDGPALTAPLRIAPRRDRRVTDIEMIDLAYYNAPLQAVLQRFADIAEEDVVIERYLNPNEPVTVDTYGPVNLEAALRAIVSSLEARNISLVTVDGSSSRACRKARPVSP